MEWMDRTDKRESIFRKGSEQENMAPMRKLKVNQYG